MTVLRGQSKAYRYPVGLAIVLHTALAIWVPPRFEVDSEVYTAQAQALVTHGASLDASGQPETRYPPGYPLFLSAFLAAGLGYRGAVVAQHLLWIAIVTATVWLTLAAGGSAAMAVSAGVITALDLPGVQSSISILSETLAAATLLTAVCAAWLAIRAAHAGAAMRWSLLAGMFGGATVLVRPIAIAVGLALSAAIAVGTSRRWRWRAVVALSGVFVVLPMFWTIRNARESGVATLSSLAGINLLHFRAAGTLAVRDPGGIDANLTRRRDELEQLACLRLEAQYRRSCASLSWAQRSKTYADIAWPIMLGDPIATGRVAARGVGMTLLGGGAILLSEITGVTDQTARLLCLFYTVPLAVFALAGVRYWSMRNRPFAWLVLLVIGYMLGMALGAEAYSRFRVPIIALYGIVCGGGIEWFRESTRQLTS